MLVRHQNPYVTVNLPWQRGDNLCINVLMFMDSSSSSGFFLYEFALYFSSRVT